MAEVLLQPWAGPSNLLFATAPLLHAGSSAGNDDTVWPAANRAYATPFIMPGDYTGTMFWWANGSGGGSNVDIGIYSVATDGTGTGTLVTHTGSTAQSGTTNLQRVSKAFTLTQGLYYLAMALNNTTGAIRTHQGAGGISLQRLKLVGCAQMSSAFPLPATFTPAALANTILPQAGFGTQTSP